MKKTNSTNILKTIFFLFLLISLKSFGIPPALINSDTETTRKSIPVTRTGSKIVAGAADNFITVWDMTKVITNTTITVNITTLPSPNNQVQYFWTAPDGSSGSGTVTTSGNHQITIPANKPTITLHIKPENLASVVIFNDPRLIDVAQWGTAEWRSMQNAFIKCSNLNVTATDIPDLSRVTSMNGMFADCSSLTGPANIGSWNTSNVTNMILLFSRATLFNQDISNWDTRNVTTMAYMFREARAFNQNIGSWNTENVTDMESMFENATNFNQNIGSWNTANVTNMAKMFYMALIFNQNIGSWNTSNVTNMGGMFSSTQAFNQDIGNWNTANVTRMADMFSYTQQFNQDIGSWNTANVSDMGRLFWNAQAFNQDISSWNTANVTYMENMFRGTVSFNQNIGRWQLNPALNMTNILSQSGLDCTNYSATLQGWADNPNTPSGLTLGAMGIQYGTSALAARTLLTTSKGWTITGDSPSGTTCGRPFITVWDMKMPVDQNAPTSLRFGITTMPNKPVSYTWTSSGGSSGSGTLTTNNSAEITGLPAGEIITLSIASEIKAINIRANSNNHIRRLINITQWGDAAWSSMDNAFNDCVNLNVTATDIPDLSAVSSMRNMFNNCQSKTGPANIGSWNTANVTNMEGLFGANLVFDQDISSWNTANVTNMGYMLSAARAFNQDLSNWNTSNVTNMEGMFQGTRASNLNISNWDTQNVTNMQGMFALSPVFNEDISNWNTSKVTNMSNMFGGSQAFNQNISSWNTAAVTNMSEMFANTASFNQPIGNWNTASVNNMFLMFASAKNFNQDIGNWNTSAVTNMSGMFDSATAFNKPIGNWNITSVTDMHGMFNRTSSFNQDLSHWDISSVLRLGYMFVQATAFNQNIGSWQLNPNADMTSMLDFSGMDCTNYSLTLQGWANNPNIPTGRNLGASYKQYGTNAETARNFLINTKGWTITGDSPSGQSCGLDQTITATDMVKTYGDAAFVPTATASSGLEVSYVSTDNSIAEAFQDTADGNKWKLKIKKAGIVNIRAQQAGNETYNAATDVIFKLTINKATLAITANALSKEYGTADPALTYTVTGFANGDDQTVITGNLTRAAGEAVGTYAIAQGTLASDNYDITFTGTNFSITAATGDFVTVWDMSKPNSGNTIKFYPTISPGQSVDYFWKASGGISGSGTIAAGTYEVNISGLPANEIITLNLKPDNLKAIKIRNPLLNPERLKLIDVTQWGTAQWSTMKNAFMDCRNLNITATDVPDLSNVGDISSMFQGCHSLNGPANIGTWNTANVTNMFYLFYGARIFNQNVGNWNTSNVTNMFGMFADAYAFNQNISSWNTQNVTNMSTMFNYAIAFNQDISNWNTSNVTNMLAIFANAYAFNQPIGSWNTANVTNMAGMFSNAYAFNHNISSWNTSNVTNMGSMFYGTLVFNQDISGWDTQKVTDMSSMFNYAQAFNQNIGNWNTANVINMSFMFSGNRTFNKDISNWDTQKVTDMFYMFYDAQTFNQNIGTWQLNPAVTMDNMLDNSGLDCQNYSLTLQGWATNPNTPSGRNLGADGKQYGTNAEAARTALTTTKGWTITGDSSSGQNCGLSQTITASDMTKIYGDIPFIPTAAASSGLEVSYVSADNSIAEAFQDTADGNKWKLKIKKAGQVNITAQQAGNETYNAAADVIFKLTINKAALTITANAQSKEYGTADPALTYTATGFVNSDDQTALTGTLSRTAGEAVGIYAISQGTLDAENYSITYTGANFSITAAAGDFVTVWDMSKPNSGNTIIFYPTTSPGQSVDYFWMASGGSTGNGTIAAGTYEVNISGLPANEIITLNLKPTHLKAIKIRDLQPTPERLKLTDVLQWGTAQWTTMGSMFLGCSNLNITATDVPDLSRVTDMFSMFSQCTILNGPANINSWNTTNVMRMRGMFYEASSFNQPVGNWNTEKVTDMGLMFYGASAFNQDIGSWNTQNVTDMSYMFYSALVFNQNIGNWNTSQVTNMSNLFSNAKAFNQNIDNWDTQKVVTMNSMFRDAGVFNQNISSWNTQKVTDMSLMFYNAVVFNQNIGSWNTQNVINMGGMFRDAVAFNQNIGNWNTTQVTNMNGMFSNTTAFNQNINSWNTANVTNMAFMLSGAKAFNQNIGKWTLNPAVNMVNMLNNSGIDCQNYSFTLNGWAANANIPSGRSLGAAGMQYGTNAVQARTTLTTTKGWTITGDSPSGQSCGLDQIITVTDMVKTYGEAPFAPTATASSGLEVSYVSADNSIAEAFQDSADGNKWKIEIKKAGEVNITAQQAGNATYNPAADVIFKLTINKAALTITANAQSKEYGTADPALTYTATGFVNSDDQTALTGTLSRAAGEAVGTYAIAQGTLNAENYNITYTGADFTITKATLNIVADAKSKVYGTTDPTLTYTVTGLVNGDDQNIITGALTRVTGENIGTYVINQGTLATSTNYDIVYTGADFTITKATLNIVADAKTKVYGSSDPALTYTVTGFENGDDQSIITGTLSRVSGEAVGTYAIEQGTLTATANYAITYTGADLTINKATLNVVAEAKSKVYGSADPALTYTVTGLANGDDQSIITGALTRVAGENIGTYAIQQGTLATTANYDIVYTGSDFDITKATLNIVADAKSKVYGTADPALTYTVTGFENGDDQSIITGALTRVAGENIGTYAINQGTIATTANYDITYTGADFDITKATLIVRADAKAKVYGSADPALTYTVTGLANNDDQSIITVALTRTAGEAVGTYNIEQGTLATTANYDIVYTGADFDITKATLIVRADAKSKVYGSADPALTYTITGFANGDNQSILTGALSRTAGEDIGTYAIEQGTLDAENYSITYTGADLTITKATLNIVADAKSKVYGSADPALTYTVTGFENGDDQTALTGTLSRAAGEAVGTYAIEQGTLATTANYDIVYTAADFTINKATLNIVAEAKTKLYGSADPDLTYTVTGFENGDDQNIITGTLTRTAGEAVGTYAIEQGTLATSANYDIVYIGADLTITKATLNIVADAKSKVYGSADPALTYTVTGFENGDGQSIITGALTRVTGENIGTYAIEQGTLATSANYDIVYTGADLTITKATLNIVADAKSKVYGTGDPALTYTVTGFENGDDQNIITGALTRAAGEYIGTYAIEQGTLAATANYDIVYTGADLTITKATLNIVADAKSKVYGTVDPALTYSVTGFENGDDQSIFTGSLTRAAGENIGTYAIEQGTLATSNNYDIVYTAADLTITKATLNIVADAKTKQYGTADPSLTYTVTGFENGDDQSIITGSLSRAAGENIGTYAIEQGTLAATANYDIVYTAADLTITKAALNIVADAKTKVYGSADPALTYTVTGFENGDDQSILTGTLSRAAGENIGTYAIEQGTLATTANYDIVYTGADFDITKATLNIVAEAKTKVYGSADPALTYTVNGFENGDDQSILTGSLSRVSGEAIGTYAIEQGTLAAIANYDIVYTGADLTITKATLNIVADAKSKVYGTVDPALTYSVTGLVNGDDQTVITGTLSRVAGEDEGSYAIEQGTLSADNYEIVYTGADFIIFKTFTIIVTHQTNVSCNGGADGSAAVEVVGGAPEYSYSWSPYGGIEATASGLTSGIYTVTITDANGVAITQEFTITEPPAVAAPSAVSSQEFCKDSYPTISNLQAEGTQIKWYATTESTVELEGTTVLVNGATYYASQTINGCESRDRAAVTVVLQNPLPTPEGASSQEFGEGATIADLVITPAAVIWYAAYEDALGNVNPLSSSDELTDGAAYYAVAAGLCSSMPFAVTVEIFTGVHVNNGISADGDGINDYLIIDNIQRFPDNKIIIYNRWGNEVWNTRNYGSNGNVFKGYAEGVKGFKNGEKLANGTYYYILQYLYERNGESKMVKKTGYLHLENN